MKEQPSKSYLYLANRGKRGIKLVAVLESSAPVSSTVTVKDLGLPQFWAQQIEKIAFDNRMLYELRIESCSSYQQLVTNLAKRGYTNLPTGAAPMLNFGANPPTANTSNCKVVKTMLRKRKN